MFHFEITQPRGDRTEFYYVGALKGCELNTGAQSFDLFSEADHRFTLGPLRTTNQPRTKYFSEPLFFNIDVLGFELGTSRL